MVVKITSTRGCSHHDDRQQQARRAWAWSRVEWEFAGQRLVLYYRPLCTCPPDKSRLLLERRYVGIPNVERALARARALAASPESATRRTAFQPVRACSEHSGALGIRALLRRPVSSSKNIMVDRGLTLAVLPPLNVPAMQRLMVYSLARERDIELIHSLN